MKRPPSDKEQQDSETDCVVHFLLLDYYRHCFAKLSKTISSLNSTLESVAMSYFREVRFISGKLKIVICALIARFAQAHRHPASSVNLSETSTRSTGSGFLLTIPWLCG